MLHSFAGSSLQLEPDIFAVHSIIGSITMSLSGLADHISGSRFLMYGQRDAYIVSKRRVQVANLNPRRVNTEGVQLSVLRLSGSE